MKKKESDNTELTGQKKGSDNTELTGQKKGSDDTEVTDQSISGYSCVHVDGKRYGTFRGAPRNVARITDQLPQTQRATLVASLSRMRLLTGNREFIPSEFAARTSRSEGLAAQGLSGRGNAVENFGNLISAVTTLHRCASATEDGRRATEGESKTPHVRAKHPTLEKQLAGERLFVRHVELSDFDVSVYSDQMVRLYHEIVANNHGGIHLDYSGNFVR